MWTVSSRVGGLPRRTRRHPIGGAGTQGAGSSLGYGLEGVALRARVLATWPGDTTKLLQRAVDWASGRDMRGGVHEPARRERRALQPEPSAFLSSSLERVGCAPWRLWTQKRPPAARRRSLVSGVPAKCGQSRDGSSPAGRASAGGVASGSRRERRTGRRRNSGWSEAAKRSLLRDGALSRGAGEAAVWLPVSSAAGGAAGAAGSDWRSRAATGAGSTNDGRSSTACRSNAGLSRGGRSACGGASAGGRSAGACWP